jgi:hypothetical protein
MDKIIHRSRLVHRSLIIAAAVITCAIASSHAAGQSCLPADVKPSEIVAPDSDHQDGAMKRKTVRDRLKELKARCRKGKLIDSRGKEIYFVRLIGCWGNPPADYEEQIAQQSEEVRQLQKKYTVIQIPCVANASIQEVSASSQFSRSTLTDAGTAVFCGSLRRSQPVL